jgi:inosose dehydratase
VTLSLANAPTSWGIEPPDPPQEPPWDRVLAEMAASGYAGTELGPFGYLPTDPGALVDGLAGAGLSLAAGFVMGPFPDRAEHDALVATARHTCELLQAGGAQTLILIDAISPDRLGTAGRGDVATRLRSDDWAALVDGLARVAEVARAAGLTAVVHPHVGTHVEFEDEIEAVLAALDPGLVGLCVDTGHSTYAGVDPVALLEGHAARVGYVHLKDVDDARLAAARAERLSFTDAVARGIFRPLGQGSVDFGAVAAALAALGYSGWATVEQDRLPDQSATPIEEARASLAYLRELGIAEPG